MKRVERGRRRTGAGGGAVASRMDHAVRRDRLRVALARHELDAALVTRLVNVRYLSGFTGSNAALLVREDGTDLVVTDGRYADQVAAEVPDLEAHVEYPARTGVRIPAAAVAAERARAGGVGRLGFEDHEVTVELHRRLEEAAPAVELVSLERAVEALRTVKDDVEVAALRHACEISDRALADVLADVRPGATERDLARRLESRMREYGADGASFATIVASGPNTAVPHHRPTDRPLDRGDLVKIDFGACYAGYHADETRTAVFGEAADWQRELHALVLAALEAGCAALRDGAAARDVDRASRAVIEDAGHGDRFTHGLGHGVGLEIHEDPFLGYDAEARLTTGIPVTVEPGVYLPGRGGVRIEDTLLVRGAGAESLTGTDRGLAVLGRH